MKRFKAFEEHGIPWQLRPSLALVSLEKRLARLSAKIKSREATPISLEWVASFRRKLLKASRTPSQRESSRQALFVQTKSWVDSHAARAAEVRNLPEIHARFQGRGAAGMFRARPAYIADHLGRRSWTYPPAEAVPELWKDLLSWEYDGAFGRALGLHLIVLSIHPFSDANGRTARMLEYAVLKRAGEPLARLLHPEVHAHWNFKNYLDVITVSRQRRILNPFVESFMESYVLFAESL